MSLSKEWYRNEFVKHESVFTHALFEKEFYEYVTIAEGNLDYVLNTPMDEAIRSPDGKGKLSDNDLQNLKYHFVVAAALIARHCVVYGMEQEKAYNMSDFYIHTMDKCTSIPEVVDLHNQMRYDFCQKMYEIKKSDVLSKPVVLCLDYIYSHLHYRITVKQLAEYTNLSESYLSRIFRKEIGMPISNYITLKKVEQSKHMLAFSDYSITDIANYFAFSSQSHFIQVFQKHVGMTPHKYRDKHFRANWDDFIPNH